MNEVCQSVTKNLEDLRFDLAADAAYHYVWHTFADVILEDSKKYLSGESENDKRSTQWMLYEIFCASIKMLHPFMPFITETIWQEMPASKQKDTELLMIANWPA